MNELWEAIGRIVSKLTDFAERLEKLESKTVVIHEAEVTEESQPQPSE